MHKPDKATTERNAKILRELVKQPENKLCADCKRNDPRWASWNLGVYLCIRCSGIHRGMGTHISRVKSIDLDMWTPEQMESIQKWGNRRANIYWEAHLKAGHVPPDHKMESFIRSKYESRRWAMDGPPPEDPSVLDSPAESSNGGEAPTSASAQLFDASASTPPARSAHVPTASLSAPRPASPSLHSSATFRSTAHAPSQSRQLLSAAVAGRIPPSVGVAQQSRLVAPQQSTPAQPPPQQPKPDDDLFSLDFHAPAASKPATTAPNLPAKDVKQDILSLFSAPAAVPANAFGQFASAPVQSASTSSWDALALGGSARTSQIQQQSIGNMEGTSAVGNGLWGASPGWNGAPSNTTPSASGATSSTVWGTPAANSNTFNTLNTTDIWGGSTGAGTGASWGGAQSTTAAKKDDVFGDLWGDFK